LFIIKHIKFFRINKRKGSNKQIKRKCNDNIFSRKNLETLLSEITDEQLIDYFKISQIVSKTFVQVNHVLCSHSSIFVGGNDAIYLIRVII